METPASAEINVGVPSNPSTGITLILNLHGNGLFTVNINQNTALALQDPAITPIQTPHRSFSAAHRTPRRSARRTTPYSRPLSGRRPSDSDAPQLRSMVKKTPPQSDDTEVPETPHSQYELLCNMPPCYPSDEHHPLPQLQFDASPAKSDSSVTESDTSFTGTEETAHLRSPRNAVFSVTESQADACLYFEKFTERALRAAIKFDKQEEEEGSQE
ncbi:hypothetical protein GGX14DRAFT_573902 [Mycena pura]|uniref:Uncharacterized protein n=1 Tax=Mycena pura TaxID=153505 RepID=A0AAD6Y2C5_9AGAR|nr:hypothetical protein GGX14DRAFT_573902 [Mycena pura]